MNFDMGLWRLYLAGLWHLGAGIDRPTLWTIASWRRARRSWRRWNRKNEPLDLSRACCGLCAPGLFPVQEPVVAPPSLVPSALINKPAPRLILPRPGCQERGFTRLTGGVMSAWSMSLPWCAPCRTEAAARGGGQLPGVALYGLRKKTTAATRLSGRVGDPFAASPAMNDGRARSNGRLRRAGDVCGDGRRHPPQICGELTRRS